MAEAIPTIYEWAGGREAFARWLNRFYDLIELEAPDIAAMFGGGVSEATRGHVTDWWGGFVGGVFGPPPPPYPGRGGGDDLTPPPRRSLAIPAAHPLTFAPLLSRSPP